MPTGCCARRVTTADRNSNGGEKQKMKEYQNLIGKISIAAAIIIVAFILANAIESAGASAGSQIAGALHAMV